ncbi:hypothetical protein D9758_013896 [Tetrapyrgos nigripes]|uniref:Uncharacterized protein n=1 Tax=Tetrapyrgos nigripes TaxID=182062 RepID=A0A8H5FPQ9_9AGAR|nr:hypothetical protein D9758_013896 [Tetrapyrgos nigripes]
MMPMQAMPVLTPMMPMSPALAGPPPNLVSVGFPGVAMSSGSMIGHPLSRAPSPSSFSRSSDGLPYKGSSNNLSDSFQIERSPRSSSRNGHGRKRSRSTAANGYPGPLSSTDDELFRESVSRVLTAKNRVSTVSGLIPMDPSHLVLFFRTKSGITHSLDFPIDVDYNSPPALDVLIASCRPHQTSDLNGYGDHESLFYPPNLPLTTSLEIGNHPILDAIRNSLFPLLPNGHYLTVMRDKLEILNAGGSMGPQSRALRNDGRVATISVTLPVRFRGGALIVRDAEGNEEKFYGRGGKNGDMEWMAFGADCEYEVETVQKGCRITVLYGVYLKTFGPTGVTDTEPLISPSDQFLDLLSPVLNMSRGRKIAFYVGNDYGARPSEVVAETLVPMLKGGDSLLYHALKLYKLVPELHWSAGGYIWPVDRTVEIADEQTHGGSPASRMAALSLLERDSQQRRGMPGTPAVRGPFSIAGSVYSDAGLSAHEEDLAIRDSLRFRVQESGAVPLAESEIVLMTDWNLPTQVVGKERVPFVAGGEMEKLVVNALMVVFVP